MAMEVFNNDKTDLLEDLENSQTVTLQQPFIEANTIEVSLEEIREQHIIPVFIKDNEPVISHTDFIDSTLEIVRELYSGETILSPSIRLSHEVKGRVPEARNKPANDLLEHEKTIYYERMAFVIEIPSISAEIDGNTLSLMVGGVKSYSQDNLYSKSDADQHFKVFIGFQNRVCTNLCVWSDGTMLDLKVKSKGQLMGCIRQLIQSYHQEFHLFHLREFCNYSLTEQQFAHLIGKCKMYGHLPQSLRNEMPPLLFGENQIGCIVRDYYKDESFCRSEDNTISLWKLYNLFTGANKNTYIHQFVEKSANAFSFVYNIKQALQNNTHNWYIM